MLDDGGFFHFTDLSERGRIGPADMELRESLPEFCGQFVGNTPGAPIKEMPKPFFLRIPAKGEQEIGTVHPCDVSPAIKTTQPHKRHPIRDSHAALIHNALQSRILSAFHYRVNRAGVHIMGLSMLNPCSKLTDCLTKAYRPDPHSQYVHPLQTVPLYLFNSSNQESYVL